MVKRSFICGTVVALYGAVLAGQVRVAAQEPAAKSQSSNTSVHVEGCVFTQEELTAKMPAVVPVGSTQTYILTDLTVIAGALSADDAAKTIYTLTKGDQEELRSFHGKRVGVVGRTGPGTPRPTLEVVSIRDISGGCPTLPRVAS